MRDVDLFQQALGLQAPWRVERTEFDAPHRRLDIFLDFERGATFACPECGATGCRPHDTTEKTWRHLNFFQHEAYLHARTPRVRCTTCGVRLVHVPWARPNSGFTLLFEALVMAMVPDMPVAAAAALAGEHDTRVWRIIHHHVDEARGRADFSKIRRTGVDETSSKRGHNYITLFVDLDESKLVFATEGRDASTLDGFRKDLEAHGGHAEQIEEFCLDMSQAFRAGLARTFPLAGITFDKFHIMQLMNRAVDEVRRQEQKQRPELKGSRYVWIKNPENLTPRQITMSDALHPRRLNLKTVRAYHIRLSLQDLWSHRGDEADKFLKAWYFWATHSKLEPVIRVAKTVREHWDGVLRWFQTRMNNGILEGINSLIQAAKAKARGYRSTRNLIAMAYLIAGKLDFTPLPT